MSAASCVIGTKRQQQFENDVQKIVDGFGNKRLKLGSSVAISAGGSDINPARVSPPVTTKCPPFDPFLNQQQLDNASNCVTKRVNSTLESVGPYRLLGALEANSHVFTAVDTRKSGRLVICRRLDRSKFVHMMQLAYRLRMEVKTVTVEEEEDNKRAYEKIFPASSEMLVGDDGFYYFVEPRHYGSLHAHVVERKRLNEQECLWYFRQIVQLLVYCHRRGVVLRDLKLRKFVFADPERLIIRLDGLDELFICPDKTDEGDESTDYISDRHGCPAYVGPEILDLNKKSYSGRAADMWSLGVLLYVTLYGRYPFYDTTPARLFAKIRHGNIHIAEEAGVTFEARTLIRYLLRRDPKERPSAMEILAHPWLQSKDRLKQSSRCAPFAGTVIVSSTTGVRYIFGNRNVDHDQCVPCVGDGGQSGSRGKADTKAREGRRSAVSAGPTVPDQ